MSKQRNKWVYTQAGRLWQLLGVPVEHWRWNEHDPVRISTDGKIVQRRYGLDWNQSETLSGFSQRDAIMFSHAADFILQDQQRMGRADRKPRQNPGFTGFDLFDVPEEDDTHLSDMEEEMARFLALSPGDIVIVKDAKYRVHEASRGGNVYLTKHGTKGKKFYQMILTAPSVCLVEEIDGGGNRVRIEAEGNWHLHEKTNPLQKEARVKTNPIEQSVERSGYNAVMLLHPDGYRWAIYSLTSRKGWFTISTFESGDWPWPTAKQRGDVRLVSRKTLGRTKALASFRAKVGAGWKKVKVP